MAKAPITFYSITNEDGDVFTGGKELLNETGLTEDDLPGLKKHVINLVPEFTQKLQEKVEAAVVKFDVVQGKNVIVESNRYPAMVENYVASWDFVNDKGVAIPATAEGYLSLEPILAAAVSNLLYAKVFPNLANNTNFISALLKKQREKQSSDKDSELVTSTQVTSQPA